MTVAKLSSSGPITLASDTSGHAATAPMPGRCPVMIATSLSGCAGVFTVGRVKVPQYKHLASGCR